MHTRVFLQLHIATCVFCYKRLLPNAKNIVTAPHGDDKRRKILLPRCTETIKGENIVPAPRGDDKKTKKLCVAQVLINFDLG